MPEKFYLCRALLIRINRGSVTQGHSLQAQPLENDRFWVLSGQGDKKGISAETQSRVLACARSLAYEPNLLARSLNTGVSKTIGLILPSISDTFFAHIADRIESEAERKATR